jgi:tetratricopeptide (TPR) repeat protein
MYLPLAALLTAVVLGIYSSIPAGRVRGPAGSAIAAVALFVTAGVFGTMTFFRNMDYRTERSIWEDTVRKRPMNARAHDLLGIVLAKEGDFDGAIARHTEAIRLRKDYSIAYYNRASTYVGNRMYREAVEDFSRAIDLRREGDTFNNRAVCYAQLRQYDKAWADIDTCRQLGFEPHPRFLRILEQASGRSADAPASPSAPLDDGGNPPR